MGHLGHLRREYAELLDRLNAGQVGLPMPEDQAARRGLQEILEILYKPEEAAIAVRLPLKPATLPTLGSRIGMPAHTLQARLEAMADKGLVMDFIHPKTKETYYHLSPPVVGFFEFSLMRLQDQIPKKRMAEALDAYTRGDPAFVQEAFGHDTVIGRALVHDDLLRDDQLPDVLPWERASGLIEMADPIAVSYCYCRHKADHLGKCCQAPMDNCLTINAGAEFVIRRGFGQSIERSRALQLLSEARSGGLVQIADNVQNQPIFICNCCGCCCGQLAPYNAHDIPAVNPSGFLPLHDPERCSGCGRCARACPIKVITLVPHRIVGQQKGALRPQINAERCIGCAVCAAACKKKSLAMQRRSEQPDVPASGVERVVRMSIERGRLADLLLDAGANRSSRYLYTLTRAITRLPVAQRALAHKQLRSRFVSYILSQGRRKRPRSPQGPVPSA